MTQTPAATLATLQHARAPQRVLVTGGSGFIGRAVCERLLRAGCSVRVPTRRLARSRALLCLPTLELVQADVHDPKALLPLLAGCDAVIHLVGILHGSAAEFRRVHAELPRSLAAAMRAAGVPRLVHVSALGVGPGSPSNYLRSKTAGEAALQAAGLALTCWRPSAVFGAGDRFINTFARLQALAPCVPLAGAQARFQPVWVDDLAAALCLSLQRPQTLGGTYEAVGPEVFTLADLVRLAGRWAGHARPVLALPTWAGRLQAALLALAPGTPLLSADNLASMQTDSVASGSLPGLSALGIAPTALAAVMAQQLGAGPGRKRFDAYRMQARRT